MLAISRVAVNNQFYVRVSRYSALGQLLWTTDIGPAVTRGLNAADFYISGSAVSQNTITLVGVVHGSFGGTPSGASGINADGWLAELNLSGTLLTHQQVSVFASDTLLEVSTQSTGATFVRGTRASSGSTGAIAFVGRFTGDINNLDWEYPVPFDLPFIDAGDLLVTESDEIYALLAGQTNNVHVPKLVRLDFSGQALWIVELAPLGIDLPYAVLPIVGPGLATELIVLGTQKDSQTTVSGVRLVRFNPATGNVIGSRFIDLPAGRIAATSMALGSGGASDLYLAGFTDGNFGAPPLGSDDAWIAKLDLLPPQCW